MIYYKSIRQIMIQPNLYFRLARSGAAKPPPFFAPFLPFAMPLLLFLPHLRDGTDVRVLYILINAKTCFWKSTTFAVTRLPLWIVPPATRWSWAAFMAAMATFTSTGSFFQPFTVVRQPGQPASFRSANKNKAKI